MAAASRALPENHDGLGARLRRGQVLRIERRIAFAGTRQNIRKHRRGEEP